MVHGMVPLVNRYAKTDGCDLWLGFGMARAQQRRESGGVWSEGWVILFDVAYRVFKPRSTM